MRITILGCGSSNGVPHIGNRWGDCDPANPKNRRTRPSIFIEVAGTNILIDTSPDLREQLLRANVERIDAVFWTHQHADHVHGLDDLREVCRLMERPVETYALKEHQDEIGSRFGYAFKPLPEGHSFYRPVLNPHLIEGPFEINGMPVVPFLQDHGWQTTVGFRIGNFAYSTDVVRLDEAAFAALEGVETWIVDCVRIEPHPVHSHLAQSLGWIERIKAKRAYFTHMGEAMDYASLMARLPKGVEPAYDGLVFEVAD